MMHFDEHLVLRNYGVTLRRLTHDKIEMLRQWRNDPKIQQYMEYREEITPEMQEKWFQKINNDNNFYFIIEYEGKEIGLKNIRDINYEKGTGEPGLFIYDDAYINSDIAFRASLCLNNFIWGTLKLKELHIHVLKDNARAIKFNTFQGYKLLPNQEDVINQEYVLTLDDMNKFLEKNKKLINILTYNKQ